MKKSFRNIFGILLAVGLFSGCDTSETSLENSDINSTSDVLNFTPDQPTEHYNPRVDYTSEELTEIIRNHSDFAVSGELISKVPKSIDHVSTFYNGSTPQLNGQAAIDDFKTAFEFLFPEEEFDEDCFFYHGNLTKNSDSNGVIFTTVNTNLDKIKNGEEKINMLYYLGGQSGEPKENRVTLVTQTPFGNTFTSFNKNVTSKIQYELGLTESYGSDIFTPYELERVGVYDVDSEKSFPLLDKETSINDAVNYFYEFVESMPCVIEPYYSLSVNEVEVYKLKDDLYCYLFLTSKKYDNIPFDYKTEGVITVRKNADLGQALMIKSDDVDYMYQMFRLETVMDEEKHTEYLPFEKAIEIVRENMTTHVGFEVVRAELIYCTDDDLGTGKHGETCYPIFPAWKIVLYNANDECNYNCYVHLLTGEFECYK